MTDYQGLVQMMQAGQNAYSKNRPDPGTQLYGFTQGGGMQVAQPPAKQGSGGNPWYDMLGVNKNPVMGAVFNPGGEAFKAKTPAPLLDPIGYSAGWYKPGSTAGNAMKKVNDPLKVFGGK